MKWNHWLIAMHALVLASACSLGEASTAVTAPAPDGRGSSASQSLTMQVAAHPVDVILGRPTRNSVIASVLAYREADGFIEYGNQSGSYANRTAQYHFSKGHPAEVAIASLQPDTEYFYRLVYSAENSRESTPLAERSFHTQRSPASPFTFTLQADSHLDSNSSLEVYSRTLANAVADRPDFHIDLGDTFMTDKYQPYSAAEQQYLAQRYYFGQIADSAPLFLALGNHDGERGDRSSGAADSMSVWSARLRNQLFPNPAPDHFYTGNPVQHRAAGLLRDYYAWEWGNALFVVLDPYWPTTRQANNGDNWGMTLGQEQYAWLGRTLSDSDAQFKFVFIHQLVGGLDAGGRGGAEAAPYFEWGGRNLDGGDGFAARRPGWALPVHQLLVQNGVNIVFHGHDHLFARQELDGIVYQAVPQPSQARYSGANSAREYGYVSGDILGSSGHLRVTVSEARATVDYVRSYLSKDETATRRNGGVDGSYIINSR